MTGRAAAVARFRSLLIVTYGRSGSTLLQGLLNSFPGTLIRGENENFSEGLFRAWNRLRRAAAFDFTAGSESPTHAWYGIREVDLDDFARRCGEMIRDVLLPTPALRRDVRCYGFKEIRYFQMLDIFDEYLQFMRRVMPELGIIFNVRAHDDVVRSGWWVKQDEASVRRILTGAEAAFERYYRSHPDHSFWVSYEDLLAQGQTLQALHDFLMETYDERRIASVFGRKHSSIGAATQPKLRLGGPG